MKKERVTSQPLYSFSSPVQSYHEGRTYSPSLPTSIFFFTTTLKHDQDAVHFPPKALKAERAHWVGA